MTRTALLSLCVLFPSLASAVDGGGVRMDIVQRGRTSPEIAARGTRYIEASKGQEYGVRLTNQTGSRVAVALTVDGLNTIDGKHSSARDAAKWVLGPWETVTIEGWQVGADSARRFVFTSEDKSYGAWIGDTRNLGTISAAVFHEVAPAPSCCWGAEREEQAPMDDRARSAPAPSSEGRSGGASGMGAPRRDSSAKGKSADGDYAATGAGRRKHNDVEWVAVALEDRARAVLELRYGFRAELVELGVLPQDPPQTPAIVRREQASGFAPDPGPWCCR
jgi:hypothetical protein